MKFAQLKNITRGTVLLKNHTQNVVDRDPYLKIQN